MPRAPAGLAPRLGEHTDAVLREVLALDAPALAALRASGLVGRAAAGDRA